jgi:hypothetical protein
LIDYAGLKKTIRKSMTLGDEAYDPLVGKKMKLTAKSIDKNGFFTMNRKDKVHFTCKTRAPGFKLPGAGGKRCSGHCWAGWSSR